MDLCSTKEIRRICINTHITALKLYKQFLLVAEGNEVQIYNWINEKIVHHEIIFNSCSIHGIRADDDDDKLLFFGAKSIKIFSVKEACSDKWILEIINSFNLEDWILDIQWLNVDRKTKDTFAVITAHNCLMIYSVTQSLINTTFCTENCILYSASIISCKFDEIVIAVGTVFRKILLWSPNSKLNIEDRKIPFHNLSGHQGVIFSVIYSEIHKVLCSTSDDRSLRVWKVNGDEKNQGSLEYWENSTIDVIHVLFGHESRVWRAAVLQSHILSIGEDSLLCVWNLKGELLKKIKCHKGGSIWCLETAQLSPENKKDISDNEDNIYAFTGGSDGGVYVWNISKFAQIEPISQINLHNNNTNKIFIKDFPRICALCSDDSVENFIVSTDKGRISLYNVNAKMWQDIFHCDSFASYCLISISKELKFLALANIAGELVLGNYQEYLLEKYEFKKFQIHNKKICSMHWTNNFLLTCSTEGQMALWEVTYTNEFRISLRQNLFLPKCKNHWWSTTAVFLNDHKTLVVGDRSGTVSVYRCSNITDESILIEQPIMQYKYIHGDNGVTDLQVYDSFIYSAGRDGKVNQFHVINGVLKLLHCIKVSHDLEWIGKILLHGNHLLLLGFHTKDFVVWSTQLESAIMTVECGGGHRSWDFSLTKEGLATYVAIKKKEIIFCQQDLNQILKNAVLKTGISGQKFSCLTYTFTKPYKNEGSISILACGGEDNAVRILGVTNISNKDSKILSLSSLSGHLSNIRAIGKCNMFDKNSWLLASVGGRSQIIIWKLESSVDDEGNFLGVKCEELFSDILSTSNNRNKTKRKENQNIHIDPQTRLMDVSIEHKGTIESENFVVGVACSDSYFRLYKFHADKRELLLSYILKHSENCILRLKSICLQNTVLYFIGSTIGNLQILSNVESHLAVIPAEDFQSCHQSGINALDIKLLNDSRWMICSAGDDNSLMVAFVSIDTLVSLKIKILSKHHKLQAHASQITGVKILDEITVITASVDQRINIWKLDYKHSFNLINLYRSQISLVPDIANLECWQSKNSSWTIGVCGQGIEIFTFEKKT